MNIPNLDISRFQNQVAELNKASISIANRKNKVDNSAIFLADLHRANMAGELAQQIMSRITRFDKELDDDYEVGMKLVSFDQGVTFHVFGIGFYNPSMIVFTGLTKDGNKVELMQHVSQISFLLLKLPKLKPNQPKRKIGFIQL